MEARAAPGVMLHALSAAHVRVALAAAIGAGVPLVGFDPLNHTADVLAIEAAPWRVVLMPAVLLAVGAVVAALLFPAPDRPKLPAGVAAGGTLLLAAACASVAGSEDPLMSAFIAVLAVSCSVALAAALVWSALPRAVVAGAFLATTSLLLARGVLVFLRDWGLRRRRRSSRPSTATRRTTSTTSRSATRTTSPAGC